MTCIVTPTAIPGKLMVSKSVLCLLQMIWEFSEDGEIPHLSSRPLPTVANVGTSWRDSSKAAGFKSVTEQVIYKLAFITSLFIVQKYHFSYCNFKYCPTHSVLSAFEILILSNLTDALK